MTVYLSVPLSEDQSYFHAILNEYNTLLYMYLKVVLSFPIN